MTSRADLAPPLDFGTWGPSTIAPALLPRVRETWLQRFRSEYRSVQIFARYLTELTGAGAPLAMCAMAAESVQDELRHVALCRAVVERLDVEPTLLQPVELRDPPSFLAAPMLERAMVTTVTMLCINETLSVAFLKDLATRCKEPGVRDVIAATLGDEEGHQDHGWEVLRFGLPLLERDQKERLRSMARAALEPHRRGIRDRLAAVASSARLLATYPEPELVRHGLFGDVRQALIAQDTLTSRVEPRLVALHLL